MPCRQVFEQCFEVVWRQSFETDGHDGEGGGLEAFDVFALDDVFLAGDVQDLDGGLGFCFQSTGVAVAVFGGCGPEAVVGFDAAVRIQDFQQDIRAIT